VYWYKSLRLKLALSYVMLSVIPMVIFYFTAMNHIEEHHLTGHESYVEWNSVMVVNTMMRRVRAFENFELAATLGAERTRIGNHGADLGMRILIIDDSATVLLDSIEWGGGRGRAGQTLIIPEVLSVLIDRENVMVFRREYQAVYFAISVPYADGERYGAVLFVSSVEHIFDSLGAIQNRMLHYSLLVGMAVIVLIAVTSHRLIAPLKRMLRVVQRTAAGRLDERVPVKGGDEYAVWATAFNSMTDKLEQVEKTRGEFVSNVSHELKTPLSSMKVLSESLLLQESVPEEIYREFLQDIVSEVDRMTTINNDLLALVKIDQREQGLNIQLISINNMVEDILKRLSPLAEQRDIVLLYEDVRPVEMDADEIKLSLAISNIVENGIKYTPGGGTVKVVVDADHQYAYVTVQDTGIGIPEEEQGRIFARFYRVDKTRDRETGGTGLGLAISYSAVLMHGGSIRVNSRPDEGSVFIVRIPIRRS